MLYRTWLRAALALMVLGVALLAPVAALAGGVAVILDKPLADVEARQPLTIGFLIRSAHEDGTLQGGLAPLITASSVTTDEQVSAMAAAEGSLGHYAATLTFPSAGEWQWEIHPFGKQDLTYTLALPGPLQVRAPGARAAPAAVAKAKRDVKALDAVFDARALTVPAGTTVTWVSTSKLPHSVKANDGGFASGNIEAGGSYSFTFDKPGTYAYFCEYHGSPNGQGMAGTITVLAVSQPVGAAVAQPASVVAAEAAAPLPATGAADRAPVIVIAAVALIGAALGLVLRWRTGQLK